MMFIGVKTEALEGCERGVGEGAELVAYAWVAAGSGRGDGSANAVSATLFQKAALVMTNHLTWLRVVCYSCARGVTVKGAGVVEGRPWSFERRGELNRHDSR